MVRLFRAPDPAMQISDAARRCGLTARAVRLYEDRGMVVPARDASERRVYDAAALERLGFIAEGRRLGLTLAEIGALLDIGDHEGAEARAQAFTQLCRRRLDELETRRAQLRLVLSRLGAPSPKPLPAGPLPERRASAASA